VATHGTLVAASSIERGVRMMSTETMKYIYWISTGLFSFAMLSSAYQYLTQEKMKAAFVHLGYPDYFRVELAVAKVLGIFTLVLPVNLLLKEWAYAGFTITLLSAFISHLAKKDPPSRYMAPVIVGVILVFSYLSFHQLFSLTV
jgi:hypothetical protein